MKSPPVPPPPHPGLFTVKSSRAKSELRSSSSEDLWELRPLGWVRRRSRQARGPAHFQGSTLVTPADLSLAAIAARDVLRPVRSATPFQIAALGGD